MATGKLASSAGYEIAAKVAEPEQQRELAGKIVEKDMSRAEAKALIGESVARSKPSKASKGRGATAKKSTPTLAKEHTIRTDDGRKVTVSGRKGFDLVELLETLRAAVEKVEAKLADDQTAT